METGDLVRVSFGYENIGDRVTIPSFGSRLYLIPYEGSITTRYDFDTTNPVDYQLAFPGDLTKEGVVELPLVNTLGLSVAQQDNNGVRTTLAEFNLPSGLTYREYVIGVELNAEREIYEYPFDGLNEPSPSTFGPKGSQHARLIRLNERLLIKDVRDAPDIQVSDVVLGPGPYRPGETIDVVCRVRNTGVSDITDLSILKYEVYGGIGDPEVAIELGIGFVPLLASGRSQTISRTVTLPDVLPPGRRIRVTGDATDLIIESGPDTLNTAFSDVFSVLPYRQGPQFKLLGLVNSSLPAGTIQPGDTIRPQIRFTNLGLETVGAFDIRYTLVPPDFSNIPLRDVVAVRFTPNTSYEQEHIFSANLTIPADMPAGYSYRLRCNLDAADEYDEFIELDNFSTFYDPLLQIGDPMAQSFPDLVVNDVNLSSQDASVDGVVVLQVLVENINGPQSAASSPGEVYLSLDNVFGNEDHSLVASFGGGALAPGQVVNIRKTLPLATTIPQDHTGVYRLFTVVDPNNIIAEQKEHNNVTQHTSEWLRVGPAALAEFPLVRITEYSANRTTVTPGESIIALAEIETEGDLTLPLEGVSMEVRLRKFTSVYASKGYVLPALTSED